MSMSRAQPKVEFCVVIEPQKRLMIQAVLWTICMRSYVPGGVPRLVSVGALPSDLHAWLEHQGVSVSIAPHAPVPTARHCNKILAFTAAPEDVSWTILTDADLFFVANPIPDLIQGGMRAVANYHAVPPYSVWCDVLRASELNVAPRRAISLFANPDSGSRETYANNHNGGLISVPKEMRYRLGNCWLKWAQWLAQNIALLQNWHLHVDQVSFALACEEMGQDIQPLPPQLNAFPHLFEHVESLTGLHISMGHLPNFAHYLTEKRRFASARFAPSLAPEIERMNAAIEEAENCIEKLPSVRADIECLLLRGTA